MAKFEFKVHHNADAQTIEAENYSMDTKDGKLTFYDQHNNQLASYQILQGAYVKRLPLGGR